MNTGSFRRKDRRGLLSILLATTMLSAGAGGAVAQQREEEETRSDTQLETIVIRGASYETETTNSYTTDLISVGDKDTRPLRQVPQSATVLTHERLEDGNFTSLDTALKKTPGVVVLTNDDGRSSLYSRGFEYDSLYLNGLPTPISSIHGTQPEMVAVDHVEILRGPSGLFGGAGEPGGAINLRLKQATEEFQASVTGTVGSWNNRRIEADISGPLVKSGRVRGRLVGAFGKKDSWVDTVDNQITAVYGTIQADITENTTATLSINHHQRDITPFNGVPTLADGTLLDIKRSTYTGADWNTFTNDVTTYIGEVEHRFDEGGHAKVSALYSVVNADYLYGFAGGVANAATGAVSQMNWTSRDYKERALSIDAHVSKPFELFGVENNIILGLDYRNIDSDRYDASGNIAGPFNIYNWNTRVARPNVTWVTDLDTELWQFGIYGQYRIKPVDRLTLIAGGRLTWYEQDTVSTRLATGVKTIDEASANGEFTPYAGIVFDITDDVSAYASYTESFLPQTATSTGGGAIGARTGSQYEIGLKAELFDNVNASLAYFNLIDKNRAVGDPTNPGFSVAQGKAKLHGVEAELSGTILHGWELMAGYTYTETKFDSTQRSSGAEFYTPEHMLQLWSKYSFDEDAGILAGAYVGGGVKLFSSFKNITRRFNTTTGVATASAVEAPGYGVVDLQAGYKFNEHLTASLTVNNVFDKKYYERIGGTTVFNFYGEPRSVNFKLQATF